MSTCAGAIFLIRIHLSSQDVTELWMSLKTSAIFVSNPNQGHTTDTMQVEILPALNKSLNGGQHECKPHQRPSTAESVFVVDADPAGPGGIHDVAKYAKALGIVHIVCGLVHMPIPALLSSAVGDSILSLNEVAGVLPSVFFLLSGSFAIQGARKKSRCLVSASQTLSLFSTIAAGLLLIKSWVLLGLLNNSSSYLIFVISLHQHILRPGNFTLKSA